MSLSDESNLALFIDFDNVALGARDSRQRFDVRLLMQRVLEKGKVIVKRAYADWHFYKEHMTPLHEAAIELIEVPTPRIGGKNSADIRLVVDAIDLCYAKGHIDTFVIVSGDSDFSPLVSKLRENNKRVIGIGVRSSSSHLLIANCDEFIFYDDIYNTAVTKVSQKVSSVPQDKRTLFDFLLQTTRSLLQESRGVLYSSLIKDTMKRKQPEFAEANYGYSTFGDLLEDARDRGLIEVERDNRAGGTLVVLGLGKGEGEGETAPDARATKSRRRRRSRKDDRDHRRPERDEAATQASVTAEASSVQSATPSEGSAAAPVESTEKKTARRTTKKVAKKMAKKAVVGKTSEPNMAPEVPAQAAAPETRTQKKTAKKVAKKTVKKVAKKVAKKTVKKTAKKTNEQKPGGKPDSGGGRGGDDRG